MYFVFLHFTVTSSNEVYDSACAASSTHLQSAVTVNVFVLAVMKTGKIFLKGYDKQIALVCVFRSFKLNPYGYIE